jgi:hypothetical protein
VDQGECQVAGGHVEQVVMREFANSLANHLGMPLPQARVRFYRRDLYRWSNWVITQESSAHRQTDSKTIEYDVTVAPDEEKTVTYTAHYTW